MVMLWFSEDQISQKSPPSIIQSPASVEDELLKRLAAISKEEAEAFRRCVDQLHHFVPRQICSHAEINRVPGNRGKRLRAKTVSDQIAYLNLLHSIITFWRVGKAAQYLQGQKWRDAELTEKTGRDADAVRLFILAEAIYEIRQRDADQYQAYRKQCQKERMKPAPPTQTQLSISRAEALREAAQLNKVQLGEKYDRYYANYKMWWRREYGREYRKR